MSNNIKLIAFDLDGTLLDSVPDLAVAADGLFKHLDFQRYQKNKFEITLVTARMCWLVEL